MINIDELENRCANGLLAAAGAFPIMTLASYRAQESMARPKSSARALSWGFISSVALGAAWAATPWAKDEPNEKDEAEVLKSYQPKIMMSIVNEVGDDIRETMEDYAYEMSDEAGKKRIRAERFESILWGDRFNRERIEALHDSDRRKDLRERLMRIDKVYGERMFDNYEAAAMQYYDMPEWRWMDGVEESKDKARGDTYYRNPYLGSKTETTKPSSRSIFSYASPSLEKKLDESKKAAEERRSNVRTPDTSRWPIDDDEEEEIVTRQQNAIDNLLGGGIDSEFEDES